MKNITILLSMLLSLVFFGCGGGGGCGGSYSSGGGSGGNSGTQCGGSGGGGTPKPTKTGQLMPDCSGSYCAIDPTSKQYTGSGVGVWRYTNNGTNEVANVSISISNVAGKSVLLVFTNEKGTSVNFPSIYVNSSLLHKVAAQTAWDAKLFNDIPKDIREFDKTKVLQELEAQNPQGRLAKSATLKVWQVGNQSNWYIQPKTAWETRAATLQKQTSQNGRTINFWVENSEYASGKITSTLLNSVSAHFTNTIYGNVTQIAGEPWGTHSSSSLIGADQPLDIVFVNFDKNGQAGGLIGYFWALNNMKNTTSATRYSNEALALFIDTETLYLIADGLPIMLSTMAHEFTHMINYYQRDIRLSANNAYDVFLEETTATMMEDIIGDKLQLSPKFNYVKEYSYSDWLRNKLYNADFTAWTSEAANYDVAGSFGAFLLRQHGISFYKQLLQTPSNGDTRAKSVALLDKVIKDHNGEGLGRAVQRWGASIALFPTPFLPKNFGYPEAIAANNDGFYLEDFNGDDFVLVRSLPSSSPTTLKGYSHFPVLRVPAENTYTESVQVPFGVSLSVIVK